MRILIFALIFAVSLCAQTEINGSRTIKGTWDASGAVSTLPIKAGLASATPATCVASKELYIKTDATAGQQIFICNAAGNGYVLSGDGGSGGGGTVYGTAAGLGYFSLFNTLTGSGVGLTTNMTVRYVQFSLPVQGEFNEYFFGKNAASTNNCDGAGNGGGAGTSACVLGLAIYDSAGNLVANSTASDTSITGTANDRVSMTGTITLTPGTYYFAYVTDSTTFNLAGTSPGILGPLYLNQGLGVTNYRVFTDSSVRATVSGGVVDMPDTIDSTRTTWTPSAIPTIVLSRN